MIGVGNLLMGDDGAGIAAAQELGGRRLPRGVEVVDGGTGGITLLHLMEGADKVILIDAVLMGKSPGSIERFGSEALEEEGGTPLSLHQGGLPQVFALGRELGLLPGEIVLYGIEPDSVAERLGLSHRVEAALPVLVERLLEELRTPP